MDEMNYYNEYTKHYNKTYAAHCEYLNYALANEISSQVERLGKPFISDDDYNNIILPFWDKYNEAPDRFYFEYFGSRDHIVNPLFIPANIYYLKILPYLNNLSFANAYMDKCTLTERFNNVKQATTIIRCMSGIYYDDKMTVINKDKAISLCLAHNNRLVFKPSIYTSIGKGIHVIDPTEYNYDKISLLFDTMGKNFIVQDRIKQHSELNKLNPISVNTIRVNSLLTCNGVYIPYATIRVGGVNEEIVGQGTNGWTSEINSDNTIGNWQIACIHPETGDIPIDYKWVECPFGNKTSERFVIPSMDKVRDVVNKLHPLLPHFRWIGWDFTIDSEDEPVLIEMNLLPGHVNTQFTTCTPMFGDKTQNILDDYYIYRTLEGNHRQDRLFD